MKKNGFIGILIGGIFLLIIVALVYFLTSNTKSSKIKLNDDYQSLIGIRVNSDIILVVGNNKVSNILFLNKKSVDTFANQKIEGKSIEKAIELIVDKLKNKNEFNNGENLYLINYKNDSVCSKIKENLDKNFVIYGVDNKIVKNEDNINNKIIELKMNNKQSEKENVNILYEYSKNNLKKYEN